MSKSKVEIPYNLWLNHIMTAVPLDMRNLLHVHNYYMGTSY